VKLIDDERGTLEGWTRTPKSEQSLALRCRIVLAWADGLANGKIVERLSVHADTVSKRRRRFADGRLDSLHDGPPVGVPGEFGDDDIQAFLVKALTDKPKDATRFSTRDMARATGMSRLTVARIWCAFGLKPWAANTFQLFEDPLVVEKVRDVVGLYLNPPVRAVVVCVDEKTGNQAPGTTHPVLLMRPGQLERRTHDYVRHGMTDLFAALDVTTGPVISTTRRRHRAEELKAFLSETDKSVPAELEVHVVSDNSSTLKTEAIKNWLLRHPRFHLHFTPTTSSWFNPVWVNRPWEARLAVAV
jgi:transposase